VKQPSKLLVGVTTAAALVTPFVPKTVNININEPPAIVAEAKSCTLISTIIDDRGKRLCEYRCGSQLKVKPQEGGDCEKTINEKLLK
jgi:hypothetical protein